MVRFSFFFFLLTSNYGVYFCFESTRWQRGRLNPMLHQNTFPQRALPFSLRQDIQPCKLHRGLQSCGSTGFCVEERELADNLREHVHLVAQVGH